MYKVVLPLLAFEKAKELEVEKIDEFFSILKLDDGTKIAIVSISVLDKVSFDFEVKQELLDKLKVRSKDDFDIYFPLVKQEPIKNSIVNLVAPILINEKDKLIAQYVVNENVEPYLASLDKCIKF